MISLAHRPQAQRVGKSLLTVRERKSITPPRKPALNLFIAEGESVKKKKEKEEESLK